MNFLFFIVAVVALLVVVILWLGRNVAVAIIDLYAILSFEPLLFEDVLERAMKSGSIHIRRYFASRFFQWIAETEVESEGLAPEDRKYAMLKFLLESMESGKEVEITYAICRLNWLETNRHRLHTLPEAKIEEILERARAAADAPEHTGEECCERCEKEAELEVVHFVRKLPMGRKPPPRIRYAAMRHVPHHA